MPLTPSSATHKPYWCVLTFAVGLQLLPIWTTEFPAMADFPNHLARVEILRHYDDVPAYRERYVPSWRLVPNLAFDVVGGALSQVVSVQSAGRMFLSVIVMMFAAGCHLLAVAVHGRPTWSAILATYFTYSFFASWGFLNYLFGMGLFLIALARWYGSRDAWTPARWVSVAALSACAYVSHLSAYGVLLVSCVSLTLMRVTRARTVRRADVVAVLCVAPPLALFVPYALTFPAQSMVYWEPVLQKKLIGLAYPFVVYRAQFDLAMGALFAGLAAVAVWRWRSAKMDPDLILSAIVLLAVYLIAPMQGGVESTYLDRRLVLPACLLGVLAVRFDLTTGRGRGIVAALCLLWLIRMGSVATTWWHIDGELREQSSLFAKIPDGARLLPVFSRATSDARSWSHDMFFEQSPHYATVFRHAFVPALFTGPGAFPLQMSVAWGGFPQRTGPSRVEGWEGVLANFDYIWAYQPSVEDRVLIEGRSDAMGSAGGVTLYRIR